MDYITLGRTGLEVSVFGLGGGGHSRLGQRAGATKAESVALVQRALALGVTFIDTAEGYGTEPIIGAALRDIPRHTVVISTKKSMTPNGQLIDVAALVEGLEASLKRLHTDYVDVYHLHGVRANQYDHAVSELLPTLLKLREQGKIRYIGITEAFASDPGHSMLARAIRDVYWDVVMVGFNVLNQSARVRVLAEAQRQNIGVLCMFAVRSALSQPEKLSQMLATLAQQGLIDAQPLDPQDPLGFVRQAAESLPDAAYRFCRAEPGIHVVLSGTGNMQHLEQNVASLLHPPLPEALRQQLMDIFARVDTVSGE